MNILIDRLAQRFNLEAKLEERRNDTFVIRINKSKTRLFFDIIQGVMPEPPESMCYKLAKSVGRQPESNRMWKTIWTGKILNDSWMIRIEHAVAA